MGRTSTTVVVGGGCSGVLAAAALLGTTDDRVLVVDPDSPLGQGLAYRTDDPAHLLNSRAGAMSADPADPGRFVAWCRDQGIPAGPADFLPRRLYGAYLRDTLDRA